MKVRMSLQGALPQSTWGPATVDVHARADVFCTRPCLRPCFCAAPTRHLRQHAREEHIPLPPCPPEPRTHIPPLGSRPSPPPRSDQPVGGNERVGGAPHLWGQHHQDRTGHCVLPPAQASASQTLNNPLASGPHLQVSDEEAGRQRTLMARPGTKSEDTGQGPRSQSLRETAVDSQRRQPCPRDFQAALKNRTQKYPTERQL